MDACQVGLGSVQFIVPWSDNSLEGQCLGESNSLWLDCKPSLKLHPLSSNLALSLPWILTASAIRNQLRMRALWKPWHLNASRENLSEEGSQLTVSSCSNCRPCCSIWAKAICKISDIHSFIHSMFMWHLPVSGTVFNIWQRDNMYILPQYFREPVTHIVVLAHWGEVTLPRGPVWWGWGRAATLSGPWKDKGITTYRTPGPHWSSGQCRFSPGAPSFLKLPPSCEFLTSRVWDYSGRRVSPEWWWGCVCSSPTAALGSGCPRHRKSSSYGNTHMPNHSSACRLQLQHGRATAGVDLVQCSVPSPNHLLDTHSLHVERRVRGTGEVEEVFRARKVCEISLVGKEGKTVMDWDMGFEKGKDWRHRGTSTGPREEQSGLFWPTGDGQDQRDAMGQTL